MITQSKPLLSVRGVSQRFGHLQALEDVSLDVRSGEVVGLIGANGAGKTTLIRIALGLLRQTAGTVSLFDGPPDRDARRRVGYVPQGSGQYEDLTVGENLAFSAGAFGISTAALEPDLAAVRDRLVGELPLGLRRRAAFAAALAHSPDLLVLDEPTSGVGPLARARLWELVRDAAEAGAGVLVTTHHMSEASQCDRLVVLMAGRVAAEGSAAGIADGLRAIEVESEPWERSFTALRDAGLSIALAGRRVRAPGAAEEVVRELLARSGVPASIRDVPATFEEAFVLLARSSAATGARPADDAGQRA